MDALERFGDAIVSSLNRAILALRALPCPTVAAVNGPVTGGAIGLMLACDITLMCRDAFIQPYYARMGFAPDGGWTALLPERIGTARTASWLALDTRVSAVAAWSGRKPGPAWLPSWPRARRPADGHSHRHYGPPRRADTGPHRLPRGRDR